MKEDKFLVLFLGASSHVYDTIPDELFQRWNFRFKSISNRELAGDEIGFPHVIVLDTYSLGLRSLDKLKAWRSQHTCSILVLDDYQEKVLIQSILSRGASAYLHIDDFADGLEHQLEVLLPHGKPSGRSTDFLASQRGEDLF